MSETDDDPNTLTALRALGATPGRAIEVDGQPVTALAEAFGTPLYVFSAAALRARLAARVAELTTELDEGRLEQEVALLAQKADVAEELDRLEAHVAEFRRTLSADGPSGRRLDFLSQELNREANTLAAKASTAGVALRAVDLKVLIEQIREQIQNIE